LVKDEGHFCSISSSKSERAYGDDRVVPGGVLFEHVGGSGPDEL